jgi:cell division protein FtsQ
MGGKGMDKGKIVSLEERIPKLKQHRKKKANRRLVFLLSLFFLLILSVIYFQSPLSHVKKIEVTGNVLATNDSILENSNISKGMNVWSVKKSEAEKKIEKLPEIKEADVKMKLPNSISIEIKEYSKEAYLLKGTSVYAILENGEILKSKKINTIPNDAPLLKGFKENEVLKEMVKELENLPNAIKQSISELILVPKKTDPYHITLFMNDGFEVSASIRTFSEKMVHYPSIVSQLDPDRKGVIDLEVGSYFKAYETEGEQQDDENESEG